MKKFAPFLKLYTDYVQNFDQAMDAINTWTEKSPAFAALLEALQVFSKFIIIIIQPLVLWRCWLGGRKGIRPVKNWGWGAGVVICLEQGADLHIAQRMPLSLTVSCFSKIQIGFTYLVPAHPASPGQGPLNGYVCVYYSATSHACSLLSRMLCALCVCEFVTTMCPAERTNWFIHLFI